MALTVLADPGFPKSQLTTIEAVKSNSIPCIQYEQSL